MKITFVENVVEDFFRENMLNQHFPYVSLADCRIDRVLGMSKEIVGIFLEIIVVRIGGVDLVAQRIEDSRQIGLELLDRLAKIRDFGLLVFEKQREQARQRIRILHGGAHHFAAMLVKHRQFGILKNDVAGGIAFGNLVRYFRIQIVLRVLCFPIAMRHPQVVHDGPVGIDFRFQLGFEFVLLKQKQAFGVCPAA